MFFLALWRLLSTSFAFRSVWFSVFNEVTEWASASIPFAICLTAEKIGIGELS
jgi:hypothetical protein